MARLVFDHSPGAYAVRVPCLSCGRMHYLADSVADLDGPSFAAYYCEACRPAGPVAACDRNGCTRCPGGNRYA